MYKFMCYGKEVTIDIPQKAGLYRFFNESGSGKTMLATMLKIHKYGGGKTDAFTYNDIKDGRTISSMIENNPEVVLIDRYDAYNGKMADDISKLSDQCIVLLDCKQAPKVNKQARFVRITFGDGYVNVR